MNNSQLTDAEFEKFRDLIYEEAGIFLNESKKALVQARLTKRMRSLPVSTFADYYQYLKDHYDTELSHFINSITTNKTDFFRENKHFEFMNDQLLPEFEARGGKRLRIWSAGCSTGEEPYTIAITVHRFYQNLGKPLPDVKILATDIDTTVLEKGERGIYRAESLETLDKNLVQAYFKRGTGDNQGLYMAKDFLKKMISFRRLNLQLPSFPMKGPFDVIFCRNVIIYFDKETQRVLFEKFANFIPDYGYLFIGHSENIGPITTKFKLLRNTIYQRS